MKRRSGKRLSFEPTREQNMSEMSVGSGGGGGGAAMSGAQAAGGSKSLGAIQGEMPGIGGAAQSEASSIAGMKPDNNNNIQNKASNETNINLSGDNNVTQINSETTINQTIEISIMNEYSSSGMKSGKLDKMFEEMLRGGADIETLKKILEVLQQKQLEELIKLLVLLLQGSGSESGGIVNMQG